MGCWDACPPKHQEGCPEECHAMADTASKIVDNCHHNSDNPAIDCDQFKMVPEIAKETGKSQDDVHKCWAACAPKHQEPGCPSECHPLADKTNHMVEDCEHNSKNPHDDCNRDKMVPEIASATGQSEAGVNKCWDGCPPKHQEGCPEECHAMADTASKIV